MPLIHFRNILSCSSEDRIHCAENLLKPEQYKKWLSAKGSDELITCIIELEKSTYISSVDIGNDGSAFIELFVSRSSSSKVDDWTALLPATLLMSPSDSRSNINRNQVKLLKSTDLNKTCLNEKWDRLKIVCEQKFNRLSPFGLCFIKLYSPATDENETNSNGSKNRSSIAIRDDDDDDDETQKEQSKIGSFFAKKQAEKTTKPLETTASNEIRTLSNVADELLSKQSMNDKEIQSLLKKDAQSTPTRLTKRRMSDEIEITPNKSDNKRNKTIDKSQLMKNVVFVLSGFQNPLRSDLRTKATEMGATYSDDWDRKCTHLICAFPNTPKFTQVKQTGKGFIVNKQWILDCYKQNQFLSEKDYEFKGTNNNTEHKRETPNRRSQKPTRTFDDDDEEENQEPLISKDVTRKPSTKKKMMTFDDEDDEDDDDNDEEKERNQLKPSQRKTPTKMIISDEDDEAYNAETDEDEPSSNSKKPTELPDFFHDKYFYVFDNDFDDDTLHNIRRVIYAYDGNLEKQLTSNIQYVITNRLWNQDFEKILKTNSNTKFLSLDWLQDCHDENKLVAYQPYSIVP